MTVTAYIDTVPVMRLSDSDLGAMRYVARVAREWETYATVARSLDHVALTARARAADAVDEWLRIIASSCPAGSRSPRGIPAKRPLRRASARPRPRPHGPVNRREARRIVREVLAGRKGTIDLHGGAWFRDHDACLTTAGAQRGTEALVGAAAPMAPPTAA